MADEIYNIGPQVSNIDFYIGGVIASSFISSNVNVAVTSVKIANASATINIQSTVSPVVKKIAYTSIAFSSSLTITAVPKEILKSLIHLDATTNVTVVTKKIAYAKTLIGISSTVVSKTYKIAKTSTHPDITTIVSGSGRQIRISGNIAASITTNFGIGVKEILNAKINIPIKTRIITNPPTRFSPGYVDSSSIKVFLILNGKPLTDHNRTLDISISPNYVENKNWHSKKGRYYKRANSAGRRTFSLNWKQLPNSIDHTVDTRHGRDYIASVAEDADSHILQIINQDESGLTPYTENTYTVFIRSYNESLVRRYIEDGIYLYDCNLVLEEA